MTAVMITVTTNIAAMNRTEKLWILFKTTFLISMTANTGYAILSIMKNTFVEKYRWFSNEDMTDYIAMAQSVPGPIAISASMIIGYQSEGLVGSLCAVAGCAFPPLLVMMLVTLFYESLTGNEIISKFLRGMQYGVAAMLLDVLIGLFMNVTKKDMIYPLCVMILSFLYVRLLNFSVFYLAIGCIVAGVLNAYFAKRTKEER